MKFLLCLGAIHVAGLVAASSAHAYGFKEYWETVKQKDPRSLDEAIALLPEELRSSYTLAYESHGLQSASPQLPRAVLFGEDAELIAAFSGGDRSAADRSLELIQFNRETNTFEFYSLEFPLPRDPRGGIAPPVRNPPACLGCHGDDPRPIWGEYSRWPGFYGSQDDQIDPASGSAEAKNYVAFLDTSSRAERYRHLTPPAGSVTSPYTPGRKGSYAYRPNLRLGVLLSRWDARRVAARLIRSPSFRSDGIVALWALLARTNFGSYPLTDAQEAQVWRALERDFGAERVQKVRLAIPGALTVEHVYSLFGDLGIGAGCMPSALDSKECSMDGFDFGYSEETQVGDLVLQALRKSEPHMDQEWFREVGLAELARRDLDPWERHFAARADRISLSLHSGFRAEEFTAYMLKRIGH